MANYSPTRTGILTRMALVVCVAVASTANTVATATGEIAVALWRWTVSTTVEVVDRGLKLFKQDPMPAVIKPQAYRAKEHQRRQEKRERPVITASWRMCPSA